VTDRRPIGFSQRGDGATPGDPPAPSLPEGAVELDDGIAADLLPERPARGHKGSFGKLLAICGSLDYAGAALLVCRGAGRAGAGLVTLAIPESLQPLFAAKVVEATTMALPEDDVEEIDPRTVDRADPRPRPRRDRDRARPAARAWRPASSSASC
jgi:hypothetical protein